MRSYSPQKKQNSSQSNANSVTQNKEEEKSNSSFLDNRPEAIAQRKLVKNAFNVAGETHEDSNKRRPSERAFSVYATNSKNYWTEGEFKINRVNGSAALGDKAFLRAGEALQLVFDYNDDYCANFNQIVGIVGGDEFDGEFDEAADETSQMGLRRQFFLGEAIRELNKEENIEGTIEYKPLKDLLISISGNQLDIEKLSLAIFPGDLSDDLAEMIAVNKNFVTKIAQAFKAYGIAKGHDIGPEMLESRNENMNNMSGIAEQLHITGVWKIGDDHIAGIKALRAKGDTMYNIVTESEFETEYQDFLTSAQHGETKPLRELHPTFLETSKKDNAGARIFRGLGDVEIPIDTPVDQMGTVAMAINAQR